MARCCRAASDEADDVRVALHRRQRLGLFMQAPLPLAGEGLLESGARLDDGSDGADLHTCATCTQVATSCGMASCCTHSGWQMQHAHGPDAGWELRLRSVALVLFCDY